MTIASFNFSPSSLLAVDEESAVGDEDGSSTAAMTIASFNLSPSSLQAVDEDNAVEVETWCWLLASPTAAIMC